MGPPHKADYRSFLSALIQADCVFCKTIWGEIIKKVKIVVLVLAHTITCSPLFLIELKKEMWFSFHNLRWKVGEINSLQKGATSYWRTKKKVNLKAIKYISLKSKLHFYKLRQPQQIAVVILINQLASVDQAIQDFKGVALNSGLFPFRKLSSLFCIHRFPIIHYFYLFISIWGPSEYAAHLPRHILERRA